MKNTTLGRAWRRRLAFASIAGLFGCTTSESPALGDASPAPSAHEKREESQAVPAAADAEAGADAAVDATKDADAAATRACPEGMARLSRGSFRLGKSGRRATVAPFCIDRREVTVAAYAACVRAGRCSPRCLEENRCSSVPIDTAWGNPAEDLRASGLCNGGIPGRESHPVNCISFEEAAAYCAASDKRLPREEEWEWAARGGARALRYPWGRFDPEADELCWGKPHKKRPFKRGGTCLGGSLALDTTPDGVSDLAGNVSEWVVGTVRGKTYPTLRGASFWAVDDGYVKAALWGFDSPAPRSEIVGFRCAKDATDAEEPASRP